MAQAASKEQGIEYSIYAMEHPSGGEKDVRKMRKHDAKTEMRDALASAEEMLNSGKYKKIEIKQKYFDKKKNREIDMTVKVLESKGKLYINVPMMFLFAVLCGGIAFAVTYFLAQ